MTRHKSFRNRSIWGFVLLLAVGCLVVPPCEVLAGKGGKTPTLFFDVSLTGAVSWEESDGSTPGTRIGRLEGSGSRAIFLINRVSPTPYATQAQTNVNVLSSLGPDVDACFPTNARADRVYGGTFAARELATDLLDADPFDVKLNIPDAFKTNGRSTSYELFYSVVSSSHDLSSGGLEAALRGLAPGETLTLELGGWTLVPKNNNGHCSGNGLFGVLTELKITPRP